jgi:hypothetical protein
MHARGILACLLAIVAAFGLGGCIGNESPCPFGFDDPVSAVLIGLICAGNKPLRNGPPTASFTIQPNRISSGDTVRFDASASSDPEGQPLEYHWDLDGDNGAFEASSGTDPVLERPVFSSTATAETRTIRLSVSDPSGVTAVEESSLKITAGSPLAGAFTISPSPGFVGRLVQFDASASTGAVEYSWRFERTGGFSAPGLSPRTSHVYTTPGERIVALQVRDEAGNTSETSHVLNVRAILARAAVARSRGRRFTARLTGVAFPADPRALVRSGPIGRLRGVRSTGRLVARGRRLGALRRFRRARFVARLNLTADLRTRTATMRGLALATFPGRRGRACLRIAVTARAGHPSGGRLTVLGGRGPAARLAGRARFSHRVGGDTMRLRGRIRTRRRASRPLPAACARLR